MSAQELLKSAEDHMQKAVERLHKEFQTIRTGRPSPHVLDKIEVDYYGTMNPIKGLGNISIQDGRTIMIQPYDKGSLKAIEQAIQKSDLGVNPNNDGSVIRLSFPPLTEDRRKELVKMVGKLAEEYRVTVRNARRDCDQNMKKLKGTISEDEIKKHGDSLQKLTDKYIKDIDKTLKDKEEELMEI